MSDLIRRDDAIVALTQSADYIADALERLDKVPTVDAAPVVHGRWINYPECLGYDDAYCDEHIVCSSCKSVWNIIDNDADRFDFCPSCGAKMDKEART